MISATMTEIRKIRDDNSERRLNMTIEERKKETQEIMKWFSKVSKKPIKYAKHLK